VTVVVDEVTVATDENGKETKEVKVTSVTYTGGTKNGDILNNNAVPTFDNKLSLNGTLNLRVKKTVSGRTAGVQADEFSFQVLKDGVVRQDEHGNTTFMTDSDGMVDITIVIDQDDIGDQDFVIKEVVPDGDKDKTVGVFHDASSVIASVTIGEVSGGVEATSEISYTARQTDKSGVPLMVNSYKAEGSITLTGTKNLVNKNGQAVALRNGEFEFDVYEGNTKVASGTNDANGNISIEIKYIQTDVGEHTYTIKEKKGSDIFVDYSVEEYTVVVNVTDAGDGVLNAEATKVTNAAGANAAISFTNTYTLVVPSGIRLDIIPYAMIAVVAAGVGGLMIVRRRKRS
jgi:pilin isopeptide linkage protein